MATIPPVAGAPVLPAVVPAVVPAAPAPNPLDNVRAVLAV